MHVDVWSRTASKYRIRAIVLLAVNVLLFAGAGTFAFWLRSGVVFAPSMAGYTDQLVDALHFIGEREISLASLLIEPISVQDVPMQIPIVGLLMAALISIPILVSILYRFWSSLPFIAVVGFLAVMPWLAITLLGSCVLASVRPFRTSFRYMSALLGLVPAVVYLFLAFSGTADAVVGRIDPIDHIKFIAPWFLSIVAAALVFAIVLSIAKMVDYRPGAITPLLAIMFALPVVLFEYRVGRDELYYRVFENLNHWALTDIDASLPLEEAVQRAYFSHPLPRRSLQEVREIVEQRWQFELALDLAPHRSTLTRHVEELAHKWDWFLKHFPDSRYAFNACYYKARALDMRVDPGEFRRTHWIRFYDDYPSEASSETWRTLATNRPHPILNAVALLRLAQLDARKGDADRAISKLATLLALFDRADQSGGGLAAGAAAPKGVLERQTPVANLDIPLERIVLEANRLHDLLGANRDPLYGYDPIGGSRYDEGISRFGLLDLLPRDERYTENLRELKRRYPNCQILDNIDLEIAKAADDLTVKIERLEALLAAYPQRDAVPEALFRLGVAYKSDGKTAESEEAFDRLAGDHPNSIWATQAARYAPWGSLGRVSRAGS